MQILRHSFASILYYSHPLSKWKVVQKHTPHNLKLAVHKKSNYSIATSLCMLLNGFWRFSPSNSFTCRIYIYIYLNELTCLTMSRFFPRGQNHWRQRKRTLHTDTIRRVKEVSITRHRKMVPRGKKRVDRKCTFVCTWLIATNSQRMSMGEGVEWAGLNKNPKF